jgi:hypothetical protein
MSKKIETIVSDCRECKHCQVFNRSTDNHTNAYICGYEEYKNDDLVFSADFLLLKEDKGRNSAIEIPDNCPLEDYTTNTIQKLKTN